MQTHTCSPLHDGDRAGQDGALLPLVSGRIGQDDRGLHGHSTRVVRLGWAGRRQERAGGGGGHA